MWSSCISRLLQGAEGGPCMGELLLSSSSSYRKEPISRAYMYRRRLGMARELSRGCISSAVMLGISRERLFFSSARGAAVRETKTSARSATAMGTALVYRWWCTLDMPLFRSRAHPLLAIWGGPVDALPRVSRYFMRHWRATHLALPAFQDFPVSLL